MAPACAYFTMNMLVALLFCLAYASAVRAQLSSADSVLVAGADALRADAQNAARAMLAALPAAEQRGVDVSSATAMLNAVLRSSARRTDLRVARALARAVRRIEPSAVTCTLLGDAPPAFTAPEDFYGARATYESRLQLDAGCTVLDDDGVTVFAPPPLGVQQIASATGVTLFTVQTTFDEDLAFSLDVLPAPTGIVTDPVNINNVRQELLPALVTPITVVQWEQVLNVLPAAYPTEGFAAAQVTSLLSNCEPQVGSFFNQRPLDITFAFSKNDDDLPSAGEAGLCVGGSQQSNVADRDVGVALAQVFFDSNRDFVWQRTETPVDIFNNLFTPVLFSENGGPPASEVQGGERGEIFALYTGATTQPFLGLRLSDERELDADGFAIVPELCGQNDPRLAVTTLNGNSDRDGNILVALVGGADSLDESVPNRERILGVIKLEEAPVRSTDNSFGVHCVGETPNREAAPILVTPVCSAVEIAVGQREVVDSFTVGMSSLQAFAEFQTWLVAASIGGADAASGAAPLAPQVTTTLPSNVAVNVGERVVSINARRQRGFDDLGTNDPDALVVFDITVRTPYAPAGQACSGVAGSTLRAETVLKAHSLSSPFDELRIGAVGAACAHTQPPECANGEQFALAAAENFDGAYIAAFTAFSIVVACVCCALSAGEYKTRPQIKRF